MSNRTGREKCDMQSDRENTYDSSLFSYIEVMTNNENHWQIIWKTHSHTKSASRHIFHRFWINFSSILTPCCLQIPSKITSKIDMWTMMRFSSLLDRLRKAPWGKKREIETFLDMWTGSAIKKQAWLHVHESQTGMEPQTPQKQQKTKQLAKKVSQKPPKGLSQRIQKRLKINPKYVQNGVWGRSEAPWGGGPHFGTNLARSLASILRQNDHKGGQSYPKLSHIASKGSQISSKNLCENNDSFSYAFL